MSLVKSVSPIRAQPRAIPSAPSLNQQGLQGFVSPPNEHFPERQADLTIAAIATAHAPPALPDKQETPNPKSRLMIT